MARPYEWLIGIRYLRATQGRGFLSFITVVSVLGLAIGVAVRHTAQLYRQEPLKSEPIK